MRHSRLPVRWSLGIALVVMCALVGMVLPNPARAHGEAVEVVVEGLARGGEDLGVVEYGIAITFVDGDPMTGADIEISAEPAEGVAVDPVAGTVPGVYIGRVHFPSTGDWRVTVVFDSPDPSGSVEFTQTIREQAPEAPVVMVDTLNPDRVGTVASESTSILGAGTGEARVGEHRFPVVVEAFIETAEAPLTIDYAAVVEGSDAASLTLRAQSDTGDAIEPVALTESDGIHRTRVVYPAAAVWTVTLMLELDSVVETLTFKENLPWPHYTTEAGQPKVKYDSRSPERIGTIAGEDTSVYLGVTVAEDARASPTSQGEDAPSTTAPVGEPAAEVADHHGDVVTDLPEPVDELRLGIALRLLHVAALGLWVIPLVASVFGHERRFSATAVLGGMSLTAVTGVSLALWGAPVAFPGLLRWEELASRLFGEAYLVAFGAKMAMALVAFVATIVWASRRSKIAVFVTFGALAVALVAVTAMSQFHLVSHL